MSPERELLQECYFFIDNKVTVSSKRLLDRIDKLLAQPEQKPEPDELEDIIKQIHNNAFYEGNSHVIGVRDVLTIFRNYLKSKRYIEDYKDE